MKILLSNDDGVHDRGIVLMANLLAERNHAVTVVAPDRERSGAGHAISSNVLRFRGVDFSRYDEAVRVFACNGTPADCVVLGINAVEPETELVLTGINSGPNLGCDVFYSGTVAAAREGYFEGRRAVAVSLCMNNGERNAHYETALAAVDVLVANVDVFFGEGTSLLKAALLNMNVPNLPLSEIRGFRAAFTGRRRYRNRLQSVPVPGGGNCFRVLGIPADDEEAEDSDVTAVNKGFVALTFLRHDTTDHVLNARLRDEVSEETARKIKLR